jgi:uncharacterized protein
MAFVSGPRQVGKTTRCRQFASSKNAYLNWDDQSHRRLILRGPDAVAAELGLDRLRGERVVVVFDELHKYARWKTFLKGFFDVHGEHARVITTGSSRLEVYRRGGDSLMGRYLSYRMHSLSVGEIVRPHVPKTEIDAPKAISDEDLTALWEHGGYPEPFIKRDRRFTNQWRQLRRQQFVREDVRELTRVQEVGQIEVFVEILLERSGSQLVYSNLAQEVSVSVDTIRRWVAILCSMHVGFLVRPWFKNVSKALRKEPKWFAFDWTSLEHEGARAETFIACHLLKATHAWQDLGFGTFELRYVRDKEKREVDFLVVRNKKPWFLVEAKNGDRTLSSALGHFQRQTGAEHAFQAVVDLEHVSVSCFSRTEPCVVPARTLLSQLP